MPRSTREWAKRKLVEAVQHIDWAALHLLDIIEPYKKDHPEVSEPLEHCLAFLKILVDTIYETRNLF